MSFYSDASLVMIPSGYKTSKVYSAVPTDGAGDLSFTRTADTATRVGPDGLIEKVRTNLLTYSQDLTNAVWSKFTYSGGAVTVTGSQSDPFGGTNAQKVDITIGTGGVLITQNITVDATAQYGLSIWLKGAVGGEKLEFDLRDTASNGVAGPVQTLTTTWTRYTITLTNNGGTSRGFQFRITTLQGASDCTFFAYGAQLEAGVPTDYIPTTSAAVSVGPVANVPRLDYLNSSCPRLLLEPQRTNAAQYSEQLDNAWWTKNNQSVTANNTTAPDGYSSADLLIPAAGTGDHYILSGTVSGTASQVVTLSIFVKKKDHDYFYFGTGGASAFGAVVYQFSTNTFTLSGLGATATNYGSGWIRLSITGTTGATDLRMLFTPTDATGSRTFNANGTDGTWVWGMQAETAAAYATSYIPTLGAAVTRGADDCVKSSATSIIGQTEGVVYFEWEYQNTGSSGGNIPISLDGGSGNEMYFWVQTNGVYLTEGFNGSVNQFTFTGAMSSFGTKKIAIAYKNNDFALYINGVLAGTDTSGTVPTLNRLYLGRFYANTSYNISSGIKQVLLFPTRLTNAQLAELTTL